MWESSEKFVEEGRNDRKIVREREFVGGGIYGIVGYAEPLEI